MTVLEELAAVVEEAIGNLPETDRQLAADVAKDVAKLTAKALQGEDVSSELPHVRSQSISLTGATKVRLENGILEGIGRVARRIAQGALFA